jgi:hypothetical protein
VTTASFVAGHLGRLGARDDVTVHQQYIANTEVGARTALGTVGPHPYLQKYGEALREWTTAGRKGPRPRRVGLPRFKSRPDINAAVSVAKAAGLAVTACGAQVRPGPGVVAKQEPTRSHAGKRRDWRGISALQGGVEVNVWTSTP